MPPYQIPLTRSRRKVQVVPWIAPLIPQESSIDQPNPLIRQTSDFARDMVKLVPGKSYHGFVRIPDDSVVRVSDIGVLAYSKDSLSDRLYKQPSLGQGYPVYPLAVGQNATGEVIIKIWDAGSGVVVADHGTSLSAFRASQERPAGRNSILGRLMPPRSIIGYSITHNGSTPLLCVAGILRGTRVRI